MRTLHFLNPSHTTPNKIRWTTDIDGAPFHIYIPKWRVPERVPMGLEVVVDTKIPSSWNHNDLINNNCPIKVIVKKIREHTRTVRYCPCGSDRKKWEIGEPYFPKDILPEPYPNELYIEVRWDFTEGVWQVNA